MLAARMSFSHPGDARVLKLVRQIERQLHDMRELANGCADSAAALRNRESCTTLTHTLSRLKARLARA